MTLYDSSVLIDYLDGDEDVVEYLAAHADEQARATPLILYEVYVGEVFTTDPDFEALDGALEWVQPVSPSDSPSFHRRAAELLARLHSGGDTLGVRDGFIAASAWSLNERLVTRDDDFDTDTVRNEIAVDVL